MPTSDNAAGSSQLSLFDNDFEAPKSSNAEMALSVRQLLQRFPGSRIAYVSLAPLKARRRNLTTERNTENGN